MKKFQKKKENFICEICGSKVIGNGFTNHCPKCLWSKHVDVNPGDRQNLCQGLMEPIGLDQKHGEFVIIHRCSKCKEVKRNRVSDGDSQSALRDLINKL